MKKEEDKKFYNFMMIHAFSVRICAKGNDKVFIISLNFNAVRTNYRNLFISSNNLANIAWATTMWQPWY